MAPRRQKGGRAVGCPTEVKPDGNQEVKICHRCHKAAMFSTKSRTWFRFCFVPLIPMKSKLIWMCGICQPQVNMQGQCEPQLAQPPDSRLQLHSSDFRHTPAPHIVPPLRDIPKDTKPSEDSKAATSTILPPLTGPLTDTTPYNFRLICPEVKSESSPCPDIKFLTPARKPSEDSSKVSATGIIQLPTPDSIPLKRPRVKSESSPCPDPSSNVADLSGSPRQRQHTKLPQNDPAVTIEPEDILRARGPGQRCSGIINKGTNQCQTSVYHPDRYCGLHADQDTGSKSFEQSSEGSGSTSPHPAGLLTLDSTPLLDSRHIHWEIEVKSESSPSPEATSSVGEIAVTSSRTADLLHNTLTVITKFEGVPHAGRREFQCNGITTKKRRCRKSVYHPDHYCKYHKGQDTVPKPAKWSNNESTASIDLPTGDQPKDIPRAPRLEFQCSGKILKKKRQCRIPVYYPDRYCKHHKDKSKSSPFPETTSSVTEIVETSRKASKLPQNKLTVTIENTGPSVSTSSANGKGSQRQSTGTFGKGSADANSTGRRYQKRASIIFGQFTNGSLYSPTTVTIVILHEEGFTVQRYGQKDYFVHFCDYIPQYLQYDTQKKLRDAIGKVLEAKNKMPGYVYALKVTDPENEGKLAFKVGYSGNVKNRYTRWKHDCSYITGIRGWWPGSIDALDLDDNDESLIEKLITSNQQGAAGPMAGQLERLVHIELADLATHAPYLHPGFPDITYQDVPRQNMVKPKPCRGCIKKAVKHREIFPFRRVEGGDHFGREWEDIVAPVIRKWGRFLVKHFAEEPSEEA